MGLEVARSALDEGREDRWLDIGNDFMMGLEFAISGLGVSAV